VAEAAKRHIVVTNTPDVLTEATADIAFGLILGASRRMGEAERLVRKGAWKSWGPTLLLGQDVYGATLGIVGLGRIGRAVARRARGFSMKILHTGHTQEDDPETGSRWVPLEELLASSDILSLHCPLNEDTRHLINRNTLKLMKPSAVLVNTGRGGLVHQEDLYEALARGVITAAGLDVFDPEPFPADHPLLSLENVLALPHIGSASVAAREGMAVLAAENLLAVLEGREPPCRVTP
jgi:glyoxylate reductase